MRFINIRDWNELEDRMFRGEWMGGVLILLFLALIMAGLLWGV